MSTQCVLELEGVPVPVWRAEFTQIVIDGGSGGGPGGPAAWGSITGNIASQADLMAALAAKANTATMAPVATSGAYADLTGTPMLGTAAAANLGDFAPTVHAHLAASISDSTPTGRALLTAVDAAAARSAIGVAAPAWGDITGTLSAQVDLSAALAGKLSAASNLGDLPNTVAARINLGLGALAVKNTVAVADVSASGTPGASTFLRGDGAWAVPPAGGGGGAAAWGGITGTLGDQADLSAALNAKANTASLAAVATAGTYASLTGKPTLGTAAASSTSDFAAASHSHAASAISDSTATGRSLLTTANAAAARATLGLGSAATSAAGDFATAAQGVKADSAVQPAGLAPYATTVDLNNKVDKVAGKGLSTEDYSSAEKTKLAGIATGATANATDAQLRDRATHTGSQAIATVTGLQSALDAKQPLLVSGTNLKTVNGQSLLGAGDLVISGGGGGGPAAWADITGRPGLLGTDGFACLALPSRYGAVSYIGAELVVQDGTRATEAISNASLRASLPRWSLKGSGAANGNAGEFMTPYQAMVSASGSAIGGFTYRAQFSVTSALSTQRGFVGVLSYATNSTGVEPYNGPDNIGLAFNVGVDANYQMVCHPDYGVLTKQDTGIAVGDTNAVFELVMKNAPGSGSIQWRLKNLNSGASATGAFTSNLPGPTKVLNHKAFINNAGNAGVVSFEFMYVFLGAYIPD